MDQLVHDLFPEGADAGTIVDVLGDKVSLGSVEEFLARCQVSFPPSSELLMLRIFASATDKTSLRGSVLSFALRHRLPFRIQFSERLNLALSTDCARQFAGPDPSRPPPIWATNMDDAALPAAGCTNPDIALRAYMRNLGRIGYYPSVERLLDYGGLIWRLALRWAGLEIARARLQGPSKAWANYRIGAPFDGIQSLHSETYEDPQDDPLARALLGYFENGSSYWPPPDIFFSSFKWVGAWTRSLETWFVEHESRIRAKQVVPMPRSYWANQWARPTKSIRKARLPPLQTRCKTLLAGIREESWLYESLFMMTGVFEAEDEE